MESGLDFQRSQSTVDVLSHENPIVVPVHSYLHNYLHGYVHSCQLVQDFATIHSMFHG